jgi:hypothetical protein
MSQWGTLEASFVPWEGGATALLASVQDSVPTGSEDGPSVREREGVVYVYGRLRDVSDMADSFAVVAWFLGVCEWATTGDLLWDLDNGPRYRYEWRDGTLRKLRGVLDL